MRAVLFLSVLVFSACGSRGPLFVEDPDAPRPDAGADPDAGDRDTGTPRPDGGVCPDGLALCGGRCVDTNSNPAHCGGCFDPCADDEFCGGGECIPRGEGCPEPLTSCGGDCVDTQVDPSHC